MYVRMYVSIIPCCSMYCCPGPCSTSTHRCIMIYMMREPLLLLYTPYILHTQHLHLHLTKHHHSSNNCSRIFTQYTTYVTAEYNSLHSSFIDSHKSQTKIHSNRLHCLISCALIIIQKPYREEKTGSKVTR